MYSIKYCAIFIIIYLAASITNVYSQNNEAYGPKNFKDRLNSELTNNFHLSDQSDIQSRDYLVFSTSESFELLFRIEFNDSTNSLILDYYNNIITNRDALETIFQITNLDLINNVETTSIDLFTIQPLLHSYFSIGSNDSNELILKDRATIEFDANEVPSFLAFEDDSGYLKAAEQYVYNSTVQLYVKNPDWVSKWVKHMDSSLSLTLDKNLATTVKYSNAYNTFDLRLETGSDFNPKSITWQTNPFAQYPTNTSSYYQHAFSTDQFSNDIDVFYKQQFRENAESEQNAIEYLDSIEKFLIQNGEKLRYQKEYYLSFRERLLQSTISSSDIYNAELDQHTVSEVYFTMAYDSEGNYHPFMVIATYNISEGPNFLIDVARPPGDGSTNSYETQSITRNATLATHLMKIPLKDYGLVDQFSDNDLSEFGTLASDVGISVDQSDEYSYASLRDMGVAIDGVKIYPSYNNTLNFASAAGEISITGIHVGRGMDLHYHADGHAYNGNGLNLYNAVDYDGRTHAPMIGFSYDGILLFGRYENENLEGFNEVLDTFGGHQHGDYAYHYHAFSSEKEIVDTRTNQITGSFIHHHLFVGAFKGNIASIPGLLETNTSQVKSAELAKYVGGDGTYIPIPLNNDVELLIIDFSLEQNYPNPFNPSTQIKYALPEATQVTLEVFNSVGQKVMELVNTQKPAGYHTATFDASGLSSGVYLYKLTTPLFAETKKMLLIK